MDYGTKGVSLGDACAHFSIASAPPSHVSWPPCLSSALLPDLSAFLPNGGDSTTKLGRRIVLAA